MSLASRDVEQAYKTLKNIGKHRIDDSFGSLYLQEQFDLQNDQVEKQIAHGGNAYGIDAFHFDSERHNLYLYQFKWSSDHSRFKESLRELTSNGIEFLFGDPRSVANPDQFLLRLKSLINENRSIIDQVLIQFVFDGEPADAEQSPVLMDILEELEGKKYIIDDFFGNRSARLMIEFRSNRSDALGGMVRNVRTHKYQIDFKHPIMSETPAGEQLQLGFVKLIDLYKMYEDMGSRFFDKNIRSGLSAEKPTNKSLQKSFKQIVIQEKIEPEAFLFYHNGITIAAEQLEMKKGAAYITEPRLLNGAQTVTSLARFIEAHEGNPEFDENRSLLERIRVIGKVVSTASDEFVSNVTICNNRQNPVEPWNLRANDPKQLEYQEKFRDDLAIYYERQEGAFVNMSEGALDELGVDDAKAIQIKRLAQTFLAVQGEIDKLSRIRDIFENETLYHGTFRDSYLRSDSKKILLAYKIQFRINAAVREIIEKYPTKYHYLGRAKNLVWALLVQGLLNDKNAKDYIETFGKSLAVEIDFTDTLKDLSTRKIRLILADLTAPDRYKDMIEVSKFGFLRTKATYQRCMEIAAERFNWRKLSI